MFKKKKKRPKGKAQRSPGKLRKRVNLPDQSTLPSWYPTPQSHQTSLHARSPLFNTKATDERGVRLTTGGQETVSEEKGKSIRMRTTYSPWGQRESKTRETSRDELWVCVWPPRLVSVIINILKYFL